MADVLVSQRMAGTADRVWQLVGGWNTLPAWHPEVAASEVTGDGLVRLVRLSDGTEISERLEHYDRAQRRYDYVIVDSPLPLASYRSTISVEAVGDAAALVTWSTVFEPAGVSESDLAVMLRDFYAAGLASVERLLDGR